MRGHAGLWSCGPRHMLAGTSSVDPAPVADLDDQDEQHLVVHFVDDSVVTDAQPVGALSLELFATKGTRIAEQSV